jgi:hypothetical protein
VNQRLRHSKKGISNFKSELSVFCKSRYYKGYGRAEKEIPIKNDEDSHLVAGSIQLSNFDLIKDIVKIVDLIEETDFLV